MNRKMSLALLLLPVAAFAEEHAPVLLCAQTADGKVRLSFDTEEETVLYDRKGSTPIKLLFKGERWVGDPGGRGRPSAFEYTWQERINGKAHGSYRYRLMGAGFYDFRYISPAGRVLEFPKLVNENSGEKCRF